MKIMRLLSAICVAFVLLLGPQVASALTSSGWKGDLYGFASLTGWHQSGSNVHSNHEVCLENHGATVVTYTWEFKTSIPEVAGAFEDPNGSGTLGANEVFEKDRLPLSMNLVEKNVPRGQSFQWSLYTRVDVGAKIWRVDLTSQVYH